MKTLYGLTELMVYGTTSLDDFNQFLADYGGQIVDIQITDKGFYAVYRP